MASEDERENKADARVQEVRRSLNLIAFLSKAYWAGEEAVAPTVTQELWKLLIDQNGRALPLARRVLPNLWLNPYQAPPPRDSERPPIFEDGEEIYTYKFSFPGKLRASSSSTLAVFLDWQETRMPLNEWLKQLTFAGRVYGSESDGSGDDEVTLEQLINHARNYDGGGHYRDRTTRPLGFARSMSVNDSLAYHQFLVRVAERVHLNVSEQLQEPESGAE